MEKSKVLAVQVKTPEPFIGIYYTVLSEELIASEDKDKADYSNIEFFIENAIKLYDIYSKKNLSVSSKCN